MNLCFVTSDQGKLPQEHLTQEKNNGVKRTNTPITGKPTELRPVSDIISDKVSIPTQRI